MRTKTKNKKATKVFVTCTKQEESKLKKVGYLNLNEACTVIWAGHVNFPTQQANVKRVYRYLRSHAPHCIHNPSANYEKEYRKNHITLDNPRGEMPECNYKITREVIEKMKAKFI